MLRTFLLTTAALALVASAANAGPQVTVSKDNRFVSVQPSGSKPGQLLPPNSRQPKTKYVYSTLAKDSEGTYFCCYGSTISGPSSTFGKAYGVAEQFMLTKAATISTLSAGVGYVSGNASVTLTLYADNGSNSPGAMIAQGTGTSSTPFGFCCGVTTASISSTSLSASTPYWVAITTTGNNFLAANFQVKDEVDNNVYVSSTSDGGSTWSAGFSETEYNPAIGVQ